MEIKEFGDMTPVDFIQKRLEDMLNHGADLGEDLPALEKHIEYAKLIEKQQNFLFEELTNAIKQETGMCRQDAIRALISVKYDISIICKQWYRENGKKF